MVKGLDLFRKHFDSYADQFILIGGTAATLVMEQAGLEFRATKDLDIVLHIEVLKPAFGTAFWDFVETGGYGIRESSEAGKPVLYRFQKPADAAYPFMLELFCRSPDGIRLAESSQLTPIPLDESVSSLSAILLDDFYYRFILEGRRQVDGMSWIGEDRLIPLKLTLGLTSVSERPEVSQWILKISANMAMTSYGCRSCSPRESRVPVQGKIREDLSRFLLQLTADATYTTKALGIDTPLAEVVARISRAYLLES